MNILENRTSKKYFATQKAVERHQPPDRAGQHLLDCWDPTAPVKPPPIG